MRVKAIRIEQAAYDEKEVNERINAEIAKLEHEGFVLKDIRVAVGRDADASSELTMRYSVTMLLMYL